MVSKARRRVRRGRFGGKRRRAFGKRHIYSLITANKTYKFRQLVVPCLGTAATVNYNISGSMTFDTAAATGPTVANAAGNTFGGLAMCFRLFDLDQVASFVALFDQYRFMKIVLKFIPMQNVVLTSATQDLGMVLYAPDFDDIVAPTADNYLRQYNTVKEVSGLKPFTITIYPRIAYGVYNTGGLIQQSGNQRAPWIDTANTGVQHFGFKMSCSHSVQLLQWSIYAQYFVEFRNVR